MADAFFGSEDFEPAVRRQRGVRWLPALLLAAFLVYELTAQPGLGAAVICLKFAWEDWRTALWLRRTDPDRRRGRACFWLYVSFGLLKTALTGSALMFTFAIVLSPQRAPGNPPPPEVITAILTAMLGFLLCSFATVVALVKAWHGGIRLWLDDSVHNARRQNQWPPPNPSRHVKNQARGVALAAIITICTLIILCLLPLFFLIGPSPAVAASLLVVVLIVLPFFFLALRDYLERGFARCPGDCWGTSASSQAITMDQE
jgi:hypothetical protein